jgi:hypothetical protein
MRQKFVRKKSKNSFYDAKHVFATAARLVGRHLAAPKLPEGLWQRPLSAHTGQKITRKKMRQKFVRKKSKNSLYDLETRICHRGPPRRQTPCSPEVARRTLAAPIVRAHGSENHAGKDAAKKLCVKNPKIAYMTSKHVFATAARLVGRHLAAPKLPEGLWQRPLSAHTGQKITRKKMRQNFVRKKSKNSLYDLETLICHRGPPHEF